MAGRPRRAGAEGPRAGLTMSQVGTGPGMTTTPQEPLEDPEITPSLTPDGSPQPISPETEPVEPPDDPDGDPFEL
jgi:hypothetical protein